MDKYAAIYYSGPYVDVLEVRVEIDYGLLSYCYSCVIIILYLSVCSYNVQ